MPTTTSITDETMKDAETRAKQCQPAEMPRLRHLTLQDYHSVYEPSDDTYLLLDALQLEFGTSDNSDIRTTLEIGCGTGVATVFLAQLLERQGVKATHYATDINPDAIQITLETAKANGVSGIEAVRCDLAEVFLTRLEGCVDVLLFNPPYVPTPDEEVGGCGIEASWAGGKNGRVVLDRAMPQIARLLSPNGRAYVIAVDENLLRDIAHIMYTRYNVMVSLILRRRARNEFLTVLKMWPNLEDR